MEHNTREFEGRFWQLTFAEILLAYRAHFPQSKHDFGTITRAELISAIHAIEKCSHSKIVIDKEAGINKCRDCGAAVGHHWKPASVVVPRGTVSVGNGLYATVRQ